VPIVLAGATITLGTLDDLTPIGWLVGSLVAYAAWAAAGGFLLRPSGESWEAFVLPSALVCLLVAVYVAAMALSPDQKAGNDDAAGVGVILLVAFGWPPTLVLFVIGRAARRGLMRLRGDR
jgi:hypothetical protein